jgi:hypothetical protein
MTAQVFLGLTCSRSCISWIPIFMPRRSGSMRLLCFSWLSWRPRSSRPRWGWSSRRLQHPLQAASWELLWGKCSSFWEKKLEADNYVMNIVKEGYRIPVYPGTDIIPYPERNNCSARTEEEFVTSEVNRLVQAGLVQKSVVRPLCVNPLPVAFKRKMDGTWKHQLVLDLSRHVNPLVYDDCSRLTTFGDCLSQTLPGDFQFVFDLEAAYHHVRVHPDSYKYLGFSWGPSVFLFCDSCFWPQACRAGSWSPAQARSHLFGVLCCLHFGLHQQRQGFG